MSQNTRLLLIALVVMVVFGIFLQSLIARTLQESNGAEAQSTLPKLPSSATTEPLPGVGGVQSAPGATKPSTPTKQH